MQERSSTLHFLDMTAMPFGHCLLKHLYAMPNTVCKSNNEHHIMAKNSVQTNLFGVGNGPVYHSLWRRNYLDLGRRGRDTL